MFKSSRWQPHLCAGVDSPGCEDPWGRHEGCQVAAAVPEADRGVAETAVPADAAAKGVHRGDEDRRRAPADADGNERDWRRRWAVEGTAGAEKDCRRAGAARGCRRRAAGAVAGCEGGGGDRAVAAAPPSWSSVVASRGQSSARETKHDHIFQLIIFPLHSKAIIIGPEFYQLIYLRIIFSRLEVTSAHGNRNLGLNDKWFEKETHLHANSLELRMKHEICTKTLGAF